MPKSITRDQAIRILAHEEMKQLPAEERADHLFCFSVEDWSDNNDWNVLDLALREEIEAGELQDPEHERFDEAVVIRMVSGAYGATNVWLLQEIQKLGEEVHCIEGVNDKLISCPCCGCETLAERGDYDICGVCWWEDDGQDNEQASENRGGPNRVSLAMGRHNFIVHGICEPERTNLLLKCKPQGKYERGRIFKFDPASKTIWEEGTAWKCDLSGNLS